MRKHLRDLSVEQPRAHGPGQTRKRQMLKRIMATAILLSGSVSLCADYVAERKAALELVRAGKHEEAMAALLRMAEGEFTDFQKSDALEQAALCAKTLKRWDQAMELAKRIPLEPASKTCRMHIMASNRQWQEVVEQFRDEDIDKWPDSVKGVAFKARGGSAYRVKDGELAVADLTKAVAYTVNRNDKGSALNALGDAYQHLLKDDDRAIDTYRKVCTESHAYKQGHAAIAIANILQRRGKTDEALQELSRIDLGKVQGYWRAALLCARARILAAAGRKAEAVSSFREALGVEGIPASTGKACEKAIAELQAESD